MTIALTRPPARPVFDVVTANGRYSRSTKAGFTQAMVAEGLTATLGDEWDPDRCAYDVLTSMVCGDLLFMRCGPHPTTGTKYVWAYVPTGRCWRMFAALAEQGGPTEQELREDMSSVLVYGTRDPRVRQW